MNFLKGIFADSCLFTKIIVVIFVVLTGMLLSFAPVLSLTCLLGSDSYVYLQLSQFLLTLGMFIVPPFVCAYLFAPNMREMFRSVKTFPSLWSLLLALALVLSSVPFVNWLTEWNASLSLPESMRHIEEMMRRSEDAAQAVTERFLDVDTIGGLLLCVFTMAIVPALSEELFFRGFLQNIFAQKWSKHLAVFVTAFIFSFVHFQFFGFFPRFLLGVVLGYLYLFTGSLWTSIFAHFVNNALVVIFTIFSNWGIVSLESIDNFGVDSPILIVASVVLMVVAMIGVRTFNR